MENALLNGKTAVTCLLNMLDGIFLLQLHKNIFQLHTMGIFLLWMGKKALIELNGKFKKIRLVHGGTFEG